MNKVFLKLLILSLCFPFFINANSKQWEQKITTKVDVESFWNQLKKTRAIKYGVDKDWDKNMDYCSYFAEKIALSKGEGLVMSKLIKYSNKCHQTLNIMTKYLLNEAKE